MHFAVSNLTEARLRCEGIRKVLLLGVLDVLL